MKRGVILSAAVCAALAVVAPARAPQPLELEAKIPLGDVGGRIDHLAIDLAHRRLFVAELGNCSAGSQGFGDSKLCYIRESSGTVAGGRR